MYQTWDVRKAKRGHAKEEDSKNDKVMFRTQYQSAKYGLHWQVWSNIWFKLHVPVMAEVLQNTLQEDLYFSSGDTWILSVSKLKMT